MQEIPDWHCPGELMISLSMYSWFETVYPVGHYEAYCYWFIIFFDNPTQQSPGLQSHTKEIWECCISADWPFSANYPSLFLCAPSRGWPTPRQQSIWSGMVPMLSPLLPPPRSGSSSVASCLVDSPSCCGPAPSSASWPTPSRQPPRTILQETTWASTHIHIWPFYTSLTHPPHFRLWSADINNTLAKQF